MTKVFISFSLSLFLMSGGGGWKRGGTGKRKYQGQIARENYYPTHICLSVCLPAWFWKGRFLFPVVKTGFCRLPEMPLLLLPCKDRAKFVYAVLLLYAY